MNSWEEPCIIASQINHFWNQEKEKEILDVFNEETPKQQILDVFTKEELESDPRVWKELKAQRISLLSTKCQNELKQYRRKHLNKLSAAKHKKNLYRTIKFLTEENKRLKKIIADANL